MMKSTVYMHHHRRALVILTAEAALEFLSGRRYVAGLPPDARACAVQSDYRNATVALILEHPSFAESPEGSTFPVLDLQTFRWSETTAAKPHGAPVYVDALNGDDTHDGLTPERAKRTLQGARAANPQDDARLLRFKTADGWADAIGPIHPDDLERPAKRTSVSAGMKPTNHKKSR